ncbi:ATP-dependent DNA ligase LigD ligase module /ATP-dependent DNA ligase LigD phosphoesterase module /ATP-dependent DNA ligase LigD polymerase module [Sediminihabitans luteus]|uniref:DNA ligase (ATP) n=1 Tax=Sediminihabitans luteus TaxID=1138585 RepID=A0A2M9CPS0_9CELL|nr:ATP-dependent DNA ligase [Sediminihabitans luteus]PJJ73902.1 ATP-dependent DNA ligase LigD ligase module /ATP-dependent DNA ligase LigD phosphoesterase module /ATP-dependent DNA ligase LigD polymerase module [Sediminihabitans luteus]GII98186.1 ATP-dependent DNA ligase [Sediminihabitans luteus]
MAAAPAQTVLVDGRRVRVSHLDKVLYPATGTTKADVIAYLTAVAPALLVHATERPVTRKRWPDGVEGQVFFQKNLDAGTPDWVRRRPIEHRSRTTEYAIVGDLPTLVWLGQTASLEIHVPQWRFGRTGVHLAPDRLVLDLDPGPGVGLPECAEVARWARTLLTGMGLDPLPVTSGSKGLHLYAPLDGAHDAGTVADVAHELARALEADHPDLVVSDMKKSLRTGKVLVDWSQNNGAKTTIAPYSPRGRERPWVAAPRTWDELDSPGLAQLEMADVVARLEADGDLLAPLARGHLAALEPTPARMATFEAAPGTDRLATYRSMRDPGRTPEPVPAEPAATSSGTSFVIQEHHARRLHWDFRLEHDGVLVSWALPRGEPTDPGRNHLAVQTEDHPLAYGAFEGTIPAGEYGAGEVSIWDAGTYELEKWREGEEVIVVLHGEQHGDRRLALIRTHGQDEGSWLIHRMKDQPGGVETAPAPDPPPPAPIESPRTWRPMLAHPASETLARSSTDDGRWAFEMKWDGVRTIARVTPEGVRVQGRSGADTTATYPELAALAGLAPSDPVVLDGEVVALDTQGRPSFRRLQERMHLSGTRDVAAARERVPVVYMVFDLLEADGRSLAHEPYEVRRARLAEVLADPPAGVEVPPALDAFDDALGLSRRFRLEGVVAKRLDSTYVAGRRSRSWLKVKHVRAQEAVVVGWRPGHGARSHLLGSLLLAVPDDGGLRYVGRVGSGFTDRERTDVVARLGSIERRTSPADGVPAADAADARWVTPKHVVEVLHSDWTGGEPGVGSLRHAVWRGWRPDKSPAEVRVE